MWDLHSREMPEVMNEARTRAEKPTREFNTGIDKKARQNSEDKKMQILHFDTGQGKWDTDLLQKGKEEGKKGEKKSNSRSHY